MPITEPGTAVDVFAGVPLEGVDIWLQPAPRRFQVAGRVVDPKRRPLDQIAIEFGPARSRAGDVWIVTDPGGLFTLDRVPPGAVVLRARAESPDGPLVGLASVVVAIESAQDLRIGLREPGRVRGLPPGWSVRGLQPRKTPAPAPTLWLGPGETISDVQVDVGPGAGRGNSARR